MTWQDWEHKWTAPLNSILSSPHVVAGALSIKIHLKLSEHTCLFSVTLLEDIEGPRPKGQGGPVTIPAKISGLRCRGPTDARSHDSLRGNELECPQRSSPAF